MSANRLGERVRQLREAGGYSLSDLARESGVSRSYLFQVETGQSSPTEEKLRAIARALGASIVDLLDPEEESANLPEGLADFAQRHKLGPEDTRMLARISYRGKQPRTAEGWAALYAVIRATAEAEGS